MNVLFIVHATAWSDKASTAKPAIQRLIDEGEFDQIVEVVQSHFDIKNQRYLMHEGFVYEHNEISPVRFFSEELFGKNALFPQADEITLVGGVLNSSEGCLNVAFEYLLQHYKRTCRSCRVVIPVPATYRARGESWDDPMQVEQCIKDLAWRLLRADVSFVIEGFTSRLACDKAAPQIRLKMEADHDNK